MRSGTILRMHDSHEYREARNQNAEKPNGRTTLGDISECDSIYPRFLLESGVTQQIGNSGSIFGVIDR